MAENKFSEKLSGNPDLNDGTTSGGWLSSVGGQGGADENMYTDLLQLNGVNLRKLTPFQPGRGYFIPTKMPKFMDQMFPNPTKLFDTLLTVYAVGVDGIQDLTLNMGAVSSGVEFQEMEIATNVTGQTNEITFQFPSELRGQFITNYLKKWITGINDPHTDRGHYHGADLEFSNKNHTMEGIFFTLDPSESKIEWAGYFFNMMPKTAELSINNKTKGENEPQELNPAFTCQLIEGNQKIVQLAEKYLNEITDKVAGSTANHSLDTVGSQLE